MSSPDPNDLPIVDSTGPPCCHLRHKGMYVYTDGIGGETHDDYDNTIYWCLKTMGKAGPDEHYAHGSLCRAGRRCWEDPESA